MASKPVDYYGIAEMIVSTYGQFYAFSPPIDFQILEPVVDILRDILDEEEASYLLANDLQFDTYALGLLMGRVETLFLMRLEADEDAQPD